MRILLFLVFFTVSICWAGENLDSVSLQEPGADPVADRPVSPLIVIPEIVALNGIVWGWDRYVLSKDYARISPDIWKRNLREGWDWDHNHWAINFYGHPYQGSYYYSVARAGGYGFYRSLVWTSFGSYLWEMFAETEYPAPNDLITTSLGGSVYGEVLYRISRLFYDGAGSAPWYRHLAAFVLQPGAYLQRAAAGNRDRRAAMVPVELTVLAGAGSRFGSEYRFGGYESDHLDEKWDDHHSMLAMHMQYGLPYRKVHEPFDYFTLDVVGEGGFNGSVFQMDISGKLLNGTVHGQGHWLDFAVYLDYDTFYGDLATIGTVSLGGGIDVAVWLTQNRRFRISNQLYWIMLGTTDMGYDDIIKEVHPDYAPDKDSYQYNMGVKYSLYLELFLYHRLTLSNRVILDALHTMPNSIPHYGAYGWDILVLNHTQMEYQLLQCLGVGVRLDSYFKFAAYSNEMFEPMSRRIFAYTVYFSFKVF